MIDIRIDAKRYKIVRQNLDKLNLKKNNRAKTNLYYAIRSATYRAWRRAIDESNIQTRTGRLKRMIRFRSLGRGSLSYTFEAYAPHVVFFWKGTRRSMGRYIRRIGKRLRKDRLPKLILKYGLRWVGWHPGISTSKFPLRKNFTTLRRQFMREYLQQWLKKVVGGK